MFFVLLQRRAAYFRKKMDEEQKGRLSFFVLGVFALEVVASLPPFLKKMVNFQTWKMLPTPTYK